LEEPFFLAQIISKKYQSDFPTCSYHPLIFFDATAERENIFS